MEQVSESVKISKEEWSILSVLMYFDVFNYPLKPSEISQYVPIKMSPLHIVPCLNYLENNGLIQQYDGFFGLVANEDTVARRCTGNKAAEVMLKYAKRYSRLISSFPFVRGVCISGSLSKGFLSEDGDIDYFIITKPGRLWLARTFLILFKKVFLLNSKKYFCVNYFIDTANLEIPDKNLFTAMEIKTLLPMYNADLYTGFLRANDWADDYLPMQKPRSTTDTPTRRNGLVKGLIEILLNGSLGDAIDKWCMRKTIERWERHFSHFSAVDFEQAMRSREYVSKHHPQNFQKRVLDQLESTKQSFIENHNVILP